MNFVFYYSVEANATRQVNISYNNYMYNGGFSGTEGPMIEMAHYLASNGHRVYFCGCSEEPPECNGNLIYSKNLTKEIISYADVFIPFFRILQDINDYANPIHPYEGEFKDIWILMSNMKKNSKVFLWVQIHIKAQLIALMAGICDAIELELNIIYVSNYIKQFHERMMQRINYDYNKHKSTIIYNSINKEIFSKPINATEFEKQGNHAYLSHPARGRGHAETIARMVGAKLHSQDYTLSKSVGKQGVKEIYDKCDYFVYPLTRTNGVVHHDTYACVVHEAMACGAIVITWDVACMRDIYGENIILIEPPHHKNYCRWSEANWNPKMADANALNLFANKIFDLNSKSDEKEELRRKARAWALDNTFEKFIPNFNSLIGI